LKEKNKENGISKTEIKELLSVLLNSVGVRDYYKELFTSNVFTMNKIFKSLSTKEVYSLQETYDIKKYPRMIEYEGKACYWCPEVRRFSEKMLS
jgi:hypothetical protein